jgi:hypothetical protein
LAAKSSAGAAGGLNQPGSTAVVSRAGLKGAALSTSGSGRVCTVCTGVKEAAVACAGGVNGGSRLTSRASRLIREPSFSLRDGGMGGTFSPGLEKYHRISGISFTGLTQLAV